MIIRIMVFKVTGVVVISKIGTLKEIEEAVSISDKITLKGILLDLLVSRCAIREAFKTRAGMDSLS